MRSGVNGGQGWSGGFTAIANKVVDDEDELGCIEIENNFLMIWIIGPWSGQRHFL
jgi:hypothetical protein